MVGTAHSEWSIDLGNNGDFGKARQIYVALDSPIGKFALGKQRPVQYTLIAEHVDIFNHRNSPFACDVYRPFFVDDMATYQKSFDRIKFMLAGQFDGDNDINSADFVNTGLGTPIRAFIWRQRTRREITLTKTTPSLAK